MKRARITGWLGLLALVSCRPADIGYTPPVYAQGESITETARKHGDTSLLEKSLLSRQLVNIEDLDSSLRVALHYSTDQNFLKKPMYEGLDKCYLPCEVAIKLCNAQYLLKQQYPYYSIVVFDAVRPVHIQEKMWKELDMPAAQKINYIAHPKELSLHNYGAAVDVGLISQDGLLLDMGTPFDCFDSLSEPKWEAYFLKKERLSQAAYNNRQVLRRVMMRSGFTPITSEWWHFNATNKETASAKFALIE